GGAYGPRESFWVRADVAFFRQDFSESIPVGPPQKNPPTIRFDYLVHSRLPGSKEAKRLQELHAGETTYEQRDAVLFALRELTGKDVGSRYEDWLALYPTAETDTEAAQLADRLLKASPARRDLVLTQLRDGKSVASTYALAIAIPKLPAA